MGRPLPPQTRSAILAAIEAGLPYSVICDSFQVSKNCVSKISLKAGFRRNDRQGVLTGAESAEIVSRYQAGEKAIDIGASLSISRDLVWQTLQRSGVAARSCGRVQRPFRHDALDVLTPDAAYWLGMMFTDGTVGKPQTPNAQPAISLILQKRDREHLVKWRDFLGADFAITPIAPAKVPRDIAHPNGGQGTGAFKFSVHSRQLADRILTLGRYGPAVDPELAASRDFWRGVVDGDGSVGISCGIPYCSAVGSRWLLQAFVDFLGPVSSRRPLHVMPARTIFNVSTSYATAWKVVKRLYGDADTALDRKAVSAAQIMPMQPPFVWPSRRRSQGPIQD